MSTIFFFGKTYFFEIFFYHNTIPRFYWILTYIWSISLCKITQLQDSEMRPTGWTLPYSLAYRLVRIESTPEGLDHNLGKLLEELVTLGYKQETVRQQWKGPPAPPPLHSLEGTLPGQYAVNVTPVASPRGWEVTLAQLRSPSMRTQ